jgi:hypothetical protein
LPPNDVLNSPRASSNGCARRIEAALRLFRFFGLAASNWERFARGRNLRLERRALRTLLDQPAVREDQRLLDVVTGTDLLEQLAVDRQGRPAFRWGCSAAADAAVGKDDQAVPA